jgi:hypothetical protein
MKSVVPPLFKNYQNPQKSCGPSNPWLLDTRDALTSGGGGTIQRLNTLINNPKKQQSKQSNATMELSKPSY